MTGTDDMNRLIRDAFRELCSEEYRPHEEAPPIPVSFPFNLYIEELLYMRKKRAVMFRRIGWSGLVALLIAALLIFSVMLAQSGAGQTQNPGMETFAPGGLPRPETYRPKLEHDYYFTTLPDTYEMIDRVESDMAFREVWSDGTHTLERWQSLIGWRVWRGTKCTDETEVLVHGTTAKIYRIEPVYQSSLLLAWSADGYFMELRVLQADAAPAITAEQLVQWAEGLKPIALYEPAPDDADEPQE